jgi:hypothetical protein
MMLVFTAMIDTRIVLTFCTFVYMSIFRITEVVSCIRCCPRAHSVTDGRIVHSRRVSTLFVEAKSVSLCRRHRCTLRADVVLVDPLKAYDSITTFVRRPERCISFI